MVEAAAAVYASAAYMWKLRKHDGESPLPTLCMAEHEQLARFFWSSCQLVALAILDFVKW